MIALYKERYLRALSPADRLAADFSRPTFVAASFYLAARKAKLRVDKGPMLTRHNIPAADFASVSASMMELCFDVLVPPFSTPPPPLLAHPAHTTA